MSGEALRAGAARVCITPEHEVDLYAFDGRSRTSARKDADIYANVVCLAHGGREALIVSLDLIWVPRALADAIRDWVAAERGCAPSDVMVCATHAHSTPQLWEGCRNAGRPDADYVRFVERAVCEAAGRAWAGLAECRAEYGAAPTGLSVYRRKRILDLAELKRGRLRTVVANRPDFGRPCDDVLSVLWLRRPGGEALAALVNWACHPSLHRSDALSPDFPGRVAERMVRQYGSGFVPCFLQGFSGNVKAALTTRLRAPLSAPAKSLYYLLFDRQGFSKDPGADECAAFADKLADAVASVGDLRPLDPAFSSAMAEAALPHEPVDGREPAPTGLRIQRLTLGRGLVLVGMEGEIFCEYAAWLRKGLGARGMAVMPAGCAGGMAGYVPDAAAVAQGGYEVDRCLLEFGLPSRFAPGVERRVKDGVRGLFDDIPAWD